MAADVTVIVPFSGDEHYRTVAALKVRDFYNEFFPDWQLKIAITNGEPFSRAATINQAVDESDADVIVFNDADSLVQPHQMRKAAAMAAESPGLVFAYSRYRRLARKPTEDLHWSLDVFGMPDDCFEWEQLNAGSQGAAAISRSSFGVAGGYDETFVGWGYEDLAFACVCEAYWPCRRVGGDLVHMWHPPAEASMPELERANEARYLNEYVPLWGKRDELRALVVST